MPSSLPFHIGPRPDDAEDPACRRAEAMAEALLVILRMALVFLQAGRPVDLTGLEQEAGQLCAKALDLEETGRKRLRPKLVHALAELDALARAHRTHPPDT
jgi:hypothetical protein